MKERLIAELSKIKGEGVDIEIGSMDFSTQQIYGLEMDATVKRLPSLEFEDILKYLTDEIKSDLKKIHTQWRFVTTYGFFIYQVPHSTTFPSISYVKAMV